MARTIRTPSGPLVRAVYARLNAAAITQTLRAGVYGDVPPGASLPYLRIEANGRGTNTMGRAGFESDITIDVFSANGRNADAIVDAVVERLDRADLVVENYTTEHVAFDQVIRGEDEVINGIKVFHRVITFRAILWDATDAPPVEGWIEAGWFET